MMEKGKKKFKREEEKGRKIEVVGDGKEGI